MEITEFEKYKQKLYNFILQSIIDHITKDRNNCHRISVLVSDTSSKNLIDAYSHGFSPEHKISLPIDRSIAGNAYKLGRIAYSLNTKEDKDFYIDPNSEREIEMVYCFPIKKGAETIAVLNIDATKRESFSKEEITYLEISTNTIGLVMKIESNFNDCVAYKCERRYSNEKQNTQQ